MTSYLVCDKCGGYYELQPGESPDDFNDKCECGGILGYVSNLNLKEGIKSNYSDDNKIKVMSFQSIASIIFGMITIVILGEISHAMFKVGTSASITATSVIFIFGGFIATYFSKGKKDTIWNLYGSSILCS